MKAERPSARDAQDVGGEVRGGRGGVALRAVLGATLVLWQLGMIAYARFDPGRYFTWSPHDVVWTFDLVVETPAGTLDHDGAVARYRLRRYRRQEHAIEHIKRAVRQYERTHGRDDQARVTMTYDKNGHTPQVWTWPEESLQPALTGPGARPDVEPGSRSGAGPVEKQANSETSDDEGGGA